MRGSSAGRTTVVGIDLSFRGPAAVALKPGWNLDFAVPYVDGVFDVKGERVYARMNRIAETLVAFAFTNKATHVFIEEYAHGLAKLAHASLLRELGGVVKSYFWSRRQLELVPVTAAQARKFLLCKLPRSDVKVYVQEKVYAMGAPKRWTDNCIDAIVIANYGRHSLGLSALSVGG